MPLPLTGPDNIPRLIRAAPIGISITDAAGRYEKVNPAYCDFSGYEERELLGRSFTMMVAEPEHPRLIRGEPARRNRVLPAPG